MEYTTISQEERDDKVAAAIISREQEHYHYQINIDNYRHIAEQLKALPDEWPEDIRKFRALKGQALADAVKGEAFDRASQFSHRDRVRHLLATEIAEQAKCETVHAALCEQLPAGGRRDAAIKRVQAKQKA